MALARFKDLVIDVNDEDLMAPFWGDALGLRRSPDRRDPGLLLGEAPEQAVWLNAVPERRSVKQRVHLDVVTDGVATLEHLGARVLQQPDPTVGRTWAVLADPEGGELCAFTREPDRLGDYRLYEVIVDCAEPETVARFWGGVLGVPVGHRDEEDWWWLEETSGVVPFSDWVFTAVPEPKTVKNRIHWDLWAPSVPALVDAGATVLRQQPDWAVLADPEGNEFCAFAPH